MGWDRTYRLSKQGKTMVKEGTIWQHNNGLQYIITGVANEWSENEKYPKTVIYHGADFKVWAKPLDNFLETMSPAHPEQESNKCVHTEHCCVFHGCNYWETDCPVEKGTKNQTYNCEQCT